MQMTVLLHVFEFQAILLDNPYTRIIGIAKGRPVFVTYFNKNGIV
jgi:hypothetical protein